MTVTELTTKDMKRIKWMQTVRVFLLAVVLVISGLLIADNTQRVRIGWLFDDQRMRLAIALGAAWGAGLLAGLLIGWPVGRRVIERSERAADVDLAGEERESAATPPPTTLDTTPADATAQSSPPPPGPPRLVRH